MKNQTADILLAENDYTSLPNDDALHLILNNLEDTFFLIDKDLRILSTTKHTKGKVNELFGVEIKDGTNVLELAPPERHDFLRKLYEEVFAGVEKRTYTEVVSEGETIFFEHHFKPARNQQGLIVGAIIISRNITANKKAESDLKETEERWRFALEGSKQGVWDWNIKTGVVFYSSSYKKLYGFAEGELSNSIEEWEKRIHPHDLERMKAAIEKHTSNESLHHEEIYRIKNQEGNYRWVHARGMLIGCDEKGKALRMIGTHTDITDQILAEEKLRLSEQQYKSLFESNPLPCWIYDANTFQFLEVNSAALQHYGYTRKEFCNSTLFDIHPEIHLEKLQERLSLEKTKKNLAYNNWQHKTKNGEIIFVDLRISTVLYKGIEARLVVTNDVTTKVLAEKELRKSNERFSYAAKASSEALWEWDVLSGEFYISQAYTDIFGWTINEKRQFDEWYDYIYPDDKEATVREFYAAVADPKTERWSKEYRYLIAGGGYAIVIDKAIILRNREGVAIKVIGAIKDITQQKKAEYDLKISNERFLFVSRATSDAIYDWDIKTNDLHWGEGLQSLFGFHPLEVPMAVWENSIHADDSKRVHDSLIKALDKSRKNFWKEEYRFLKKDGGFSDVLDRGFIIRDDSGHAIRMIGSMQDITERKYNEKLLSLERSIFELSTDPKLQLKHVVEMLLRGIEKIHEDALTSVLILNDDDTISPLSSPSLPCEFSSALRGIKIGPGVGSCGTAMSTRQMVIVEDIDNNQLWKNYKSLTSQFDLRACWSLPIIHSSGKVMGSFAVYYKEVKSPSYNELNTLERVRNILRVLMEHHWSLNEIKVANERFDIMMKATHDLIWDWNIETNNIYRDEIGLKKVYGVSDNKSIENIYAWLKRVHPEDQAVAEKLINEILVAKDQRAFELEYRFQKDDGSYSYVYDRGMIMRNTEGKPIRMIGAAQDITERKKLQQEILQNELERQKAINQATVDTQEKERSEIGKELHDNVNQVLTTTKLYLDLAVSNPELKDGLIEKSTKNILSVINEIRQLSRSLMDPSIGDLGLVDSIHDLIENINMTRKLHVTLFADRKIEALMTSTHKLTVFRIIQEALNNAMRHAKATNVTISFTRHKKMIGITIADDGIGFQPSLIKKGAGLKNIQNRIYLINGTHHIHSSPKKGCKIVINFPIINQQ